MERLLMQEFNELSSDRDISLGGMGGALIGSIKFPSIKAYLEMGLSSIDLPVDIYVRLIKRLDQEYVSMKQADIDAEMKKSTKSSKGRPPPK
jgi:hypothetical protein